jgi:peroxiredoxin
VKPEGKNGVLLIFYETGCEFCSHELKQIREHYADLQQKGIRVISIASDTDRKVFESWAKDFPWSDKLFDGKGFLGENFKNYAVLGTPTLFVVDKEGKIAGRYATLEETKLLDK